MTPEPGQIGQNQFPPPNLDPKQEELCKRLDEFYSKYSFEVKPSDMFRGAIFTMRPELRANPDWLAQAAHSLRDILYPFSNDGVPNKEEALRQFGSVRVDTKTGRELGRIFGTLSLLAHHGNGRGNIKYSEFTPENFEELVSQFENVMFDVLARQIDVHAEIDNLISDSDQEAINT